KYKIKTPQTIKKGIQEAANVAEEASKSAIEVIKNTSDDVATFYNRPKSPSKVKTNHYWKYTAEQNKLRKEASETVFIGEGSNSVRATKRIIETPYAVNVPKEPVITTPYAVNIPKEPLIESAYIHKPTEPIIESAYVQKPKGEIILP
ncbi:MAG TPA: hypothetical protein PLG15_04275, partial [Candidatus Gastranaerophilaceae bacterium]|nr:hypothetical protein [Candidatus Gastranaerophilaceae bacterium]